MFPVNFLIHYSFIVVCCFLSSFFVVAAFFLVFLAFYSSVILRFCGFTGLGLQRHERLSVTSVLATGTGHDGREPSD